MTLNDLYFDLQCLDSIVTLITCNFSQVQLRAIKKLPTLAVILDVDRTRHELLPCLEAFFNAVHMQNDEISICLAEQIGKFLPFIGGSEFAHILFPILEKMAASEDTMTKEKAVDALQRIASLMEVVHLEAHFVPVIERLAGSTWFTSRSSATALIAVSFE